MKKIYCIASGEYSDWGINYAFESKEKRDKLLEFFKFKNNHYDEYHEYEIDLCDDDINIRNPKRYYICIMHGKGKIECAERNTVERENKNRIHICVFSESLDYYEFEISKKEYENKEKYTEKFKKIFQDKAAEVKYMLSEGMIISEVEKILNKE